MKYFMHDTSAFQDEKITELYIKFGYEGVGLFFTILEKLALQEKPIKTSVLKAQLNVRKRLEKCWCFMEEIGIISSSNGETFNENILKFSEKYRVSSEKNRKRISEWRERQEDIKNVTCNESVRNADKVKLSKVKLSKVKIYIDIDPYKKVKLQQSEYDKLVELFGERKAKDWIERLALHIGSKGDSYKNHYLTILNWEKRERVKVDQKPTQGSNIIPFDEQVRLGMV